MDDAGQGDLSQQFNQLLRQYMGAMLAERQEAIEKMQAIGARIDEDALQTLLEYLKQDANPLLRPLAASRLGEIGDARVLPDLIALLNTERVDIRAVVVQALGEIGDNAARETLENVLQIDPESDVRVRATVALGKLGDTQAVGTLSEAMQRDPDIKVRQHAIEALGILRDSSLIPTLVDVMRHDDDKETRTFAAEALGRMGDVQALAPLIKVLQDKSYPPIVRYYAAHALGLLGHEGAIEPLEIATHDEHEWVAQMARDSLATYQSG